MPVRDADPSDAEAVRDLHHASITELGPEAYSEEQVDAWARGCASTDYRAAIEADGRTTLVAETDGAVVAFGSLTFAPPGDDYVADADAEVTALYVHPSVARSGVGSRLYEELERRARARNVRVLALRSSLNAVPFYEAQGYERVGEVDHEFSPHESTGVFGTVVEMRKRL